MVGHYVVGGLTLTDVEAWGQSAHGARGFSVK
jgi:hypothetical protein